MFKSTLAGCVLLLGFAVSSVDAAPNGARQLVEEGVVDIFDGSEAQELNIICNDGTESPTCEVCRRGCCSHHGGCR